MSEDKIGDRTKVSPQQISQDLKVLKEAVEEETAAFLSSSPTNPLDRAYHRTRIRFKGRHPTQIRAELKKVKKQINKTTNPEEKKLIIMKRNALKSLL